MKFMKTLVAVLTLASSVAFAQDSKVLFACEVPAGEILQSERMTNVILSNGQALFEVIGNDSVFDEKAADDSKIGLSFDQVAPEVVDDANQILTDYVLGTDYADVLAKAGVTDPTAISAVYTFTAQSSSSQDYALLTYVFLGADGGVLGSSVILLINQNGQIGAVAASCTL